MFLVPIRVCWDKKEAVTEVKRPIDKFKPSPQQILIPEYTEMRRGTSIFISWVVVVEYFHFTPF